jgi:hypothetical protein
LETSKGARVPLSVAKNAWVKLRTGDLAIGERVGPFTVDSIEGDNLKVGCHLFSIRAINQFFTSILP